jgi:hypothetical protein
MKSLPTAETTRQASDRRGSAAVPAQRPVSLRQAVFTIAGLNTILTLLLIAVFIWHGSTPQPKALAPPPELVGVWKTVDWQYADRFFAITPAGIFLGIGDGHVDGYTILAVDGVREGDAMLYTISYGNHAGHQYGFAFYYDSRNAGVIRFKHHRNIQWTKERSSS